MNIHEYQAYELFRSYGIPVPYGELAHDAETARSITEKLGGKSVIKAQIHSGGRGKAGGVKLAKDPEERLNSSHHFESRMPPHRFSAHHKPDR